MSASPISLAIEKPGHRLAGLLTIPQVILYLLLFLGGFEGLRRSLAIPSLALERGGYEGLLVLALGLALVVFGLGCFAFFLFTYLVWRASRPAAILAVSLGLYAWALLLCLNFVWIVQSLYQDIRGPGTFDPLLLGSKLVSIVFVSALIFICIAMLREPRPAMPRARLEPGEQPRLWAILEETASRCGVRLPECVYWLPKPNAHVIKLGGFLGFGGKPALAIGLPLLRVLDVDEFRAALAHEFYHLHRGDAFLFGCIYNARRTAEGFREGLDPLEKMLGGVTSFFLQTYSSFLWHLSNPIVRGWEFEADSFAARTISSASLARALVKLEFARSRFDAFRRNWLDPVLESGYMPPAMTGFWEYYECCARQERNHARLIISREADRESETHPPLRERLLRIAEIDSPAGFEADTPAFSVIDQPDEVETAVFTPDGGAQTESIWSAEVLQKLLARWDREVAVAAVRRQGSLDVNSLPVMCSSLPMAATFLGMDKSASDAVERTLMKAFAVALNNDGWNPQLERGQLLFRRGSYSIDTAAEILRLKLRQEPDWQKRCEALNITGLVLLPEAQLPGKGRFCSRCLRTFPTTVERCPVCRKRIYA
jgi:Zn-dependent protease with chaperone function